MQIHVRYFASTREAAGLESETLDVPPGATVASIRTLLASRHPTLASLPVRVAVGDSFAAEDRTLEAGDVVALIPP